MVAEGKRAGPVSEATRSAQTRPLINTSEINQQPMQISPTHAFNPDCSTVAATATAQQSAAQSFATDDSGRFCCPVKDCKTTAVDVRTIQRHIVKQHVDVRDSFVKFYCPNCTPVAIFTDQAGKDEHACGSGRKRGYDTKISTMRAGLAKRQRLDHQYPFELQKCCIDKETSSLFRHRAEVHKDGMLMFDIVHDFGTGPYFGKFSCSSCPLAFSRAHRLAEHIESQHNYGEEKKLDAQLIWAASDGLQLWWVKSGTVSRKHVLLDIDDTKVHVRTNS